MIMSDVVSLASKDIKSSEGVLSSSNIYHVPPSHSTVLLPSTSYRSWIGNTGHQQYLPLQYPLICYSMMLWGRRGMPSYLKSSNVLCAMDGRIDIVPGPSCVLILCCIHTHKHRLSHILPSLTNKCTHAHIHTHKDRHTCVTVGPTRETPLHYVHCFPTRDEFPHTVRSWKTKTNCIQLWGEDKNMEVQKWN